MPLVIHPSQAYALLAGLFIGKFTNIFSDVVITGLVLYIVTPEIFTEDRLERGKNYFWSWFITSNDSNFKKLENSEIDFNVFSKLTTEQQVKILMEQVSQKKLSVPNQSVNPNTTNSSLPTKPVLFDFSTLPKIGILASPQSK